MDQNPAMKLAAAVATLVGIWIAVYWLWEPSRTGQPSISFAPDPSAPTKPGPKPPGPDRTNPRPEPTPIQDPPALPLTGSQAPDAGQKSPPSAPEPLPQAKRPGQVKPPQFEQYKVLPGETFEIIAKKRFGTTAMASAIARANPFTDPRRLRAGRMILIPVDPSNIQGRPEPSKDVSREGWKMHKVAEGDTLSGIAKKYYGTTTLARKIYEANSDVLKNEHDLKLGLELQIPPPPPPPKPDAARDGAAPR